MSNGQVFHTNPGQTDDTQEVERVIASNGALAFDGLIINASHVMLVQFEEDE